MAHAGSPIALVTQSSPRRFEVKIHDLEPEDIIPNGDRYVIEVVDIDESKLVGAQLLVATQDPNINPRDPSANPQIEQRGIIFGIVRSKGNGHLLGLPDPRLAVHTGIGVGERIARESADVPMFFDVGDLVIVDRNAKGRNLKMLTSHGHTEVRIINQLDVLAHVRSVKLQHTENGWERVNE